MNILTYLIAFALSAGIIFTVYGQSNIEHLKKLELNKKEKKVFNGGRDSSSIIHIDTLIMKDRSSIQFYGKKDIELFVKYAEIGNKTFISGLAGQNNASNFDIKINFQKLGSLSVIARGQDAMNGTRTYPNGDAGNVNIAYDPNGIIPQQTNSKAKNFLSVDATPGGLNSTPQNEVGIIFDRIARSPARWINLPQGLVYSGSPGKEGKVVVEQQ